MSERQTGICISWQGKYGFVKGQAGEKFLVLPKNVPPNEAGEPRMWPDEEVEFTPVSNGGKLRLATEIEFNTRVPWEPINQAEGTIDQWGDGFGFINAGEWGYYFCHVKDVLPSDNGGRLTPYVGQTVVFDTALAQDGRVRAVNVRLT